jgi:4a-hydroxytetrahydrobiopterin dehydratase
MKLAKDQLTARLSKLNAGWELLNGTIMREYKFDNYRDTIGFINKIALVAEKENHHPDVYFSYGKVRVTLFTHEIEGLSEKDFALAKKIDEI